MKKVFYFEIQVDNHNLILNDFCQTRIVYLNTIKDENRKLQSYYVWKLLLKALELEGVKHKNDFVLLEKKWILPNNKINFSLSHSKNFVAICISSEEIGVDVQIIQDKILKVKKYLNSDTNDLTNLTIEWVKKECEIKSCFYPEFSFVNLQDKYDNKYILGVNAKNVEFIKINNI